MKEAIENIKKFRELKNITREELADKLEMSLSGYSKLERGEVEITLTKLYRIADILEVSVSQILDFDASQIFNVSNNQVVNGVEVKEQINNYQDEYKDKYIKMLEAEVERLKGR
ncbi:MAG: helix-turn-helix domain-containing protein [Flavobacteriia bacterium]|jgi:transcriptional regulator with XRE-family HTH domain